VLVTIAVKRPDAPLALKEIESTNYSRTLSEIIGSQFELHLMHDYGEYGLFMAVDEFGGFKPLPYNFTWNFFRVVGTAVFFKGNGEITSLDPQDIAIIRRQIGELSQNPYRRNADVDIRALRRLAQQGDEEAALKLVTASFRAGLIPKVHLELAHQLGSPIADQILRVKPTLTSALNFFKTRPVVAWQAIFKRLTHKTAHRQTNYRPLATKLSVAFAQRVVPLYDKIDPTETRLKDALQAALTWANDPSKENLKLVGLALDEMVELLHIIQSEFDALSAEIPLEELGTTPSSPRGEDLSIAIDVIESVTYAIETALVNPQAAATYAGEAAAHAWEAAAVIGTSDKAFYAEIDWQMQFTIDVLLTLREI